MQGTIKVFNNADKLVDRIAKKIASSKRRTAIGNQFRSKLTAGSPMLTLYPMDMEKVFRGINYGRCIDYMTNVKKMDEMKNNFDHLFYDEEKDIYVLKKRVVFCFYFFVPRIILQMWINALILNLAMGGKVKEVIVQFDRVKGGTHDIDIVREHAAREMELRPIPQVVLREGAFVDGEEFKATDVDILNYDPLPMRNSEMKINNDK